jgi:hypothetical protein
MAKIQFKTHPLLKKYLKRDIKKHFNIDTFSFESDLNEDFFKKLTEFVYYSRSCQNVFIDGKDAIGFSLLKRTYTDDENEVILYLILLNLLDEEKIKKAIDPHAHDGNLAIETKLFLENMPLHTKERFEYYFTKKYNYRSSLPMLKEKKNMTAIVSQAVDIKNLKEQIMINRIKLKISQFDFDWLDVKFQRDDFDLVISDISDLEKDELDQFLYMSEFISGNKIALISEKKISKKSINKYKLKIDFEEEIELDEEFLVISILSITAKNT